MSTLVLETDPLAVGVSVTDEELMVEFTDGRRIAVPLAWYPRLLYGTPSERQNWQLLGDGYAIEWSDLDEHIGIEGLLAGHPGGESQQSLNRWLASRRGHAEQKKKENRPTKPSSQRRVRQV